MREVAGAGRDTVVAVQSISWLAAQVLKLRFAVEAHLSPGLFGRGHQRCLILTPTHQSLLDPWLIASALRYRQWRALLPLRILGTTTFGGPLKWFLPLIRLLYRLEGVIALPPKDEGGNLPEKVQGLLDALEQGDVVLIFPEGGIRKEGSPPIGEFAPGAVYLQRRSGAGIVPMAVWMSGQRWPRRRYILEIGLPVRIPESMDLDAGAGWLREQALTLYERAAERRQEG
jgi:1-acyl-sn-glycerol-3-phosphate acyltransferase